MTMKHSAFTINEFAAGVIQTFKEKYPDEMQNIELPAGLTENEQMERILGYCVKKGFKLPELLARFEE